MEKQRAYLNQRITMETNQIKQTEGNYSEDEDYDKDYLIPTVQSRSTNPNLVDKQRLVMALSDNVFSFKSKFLQRDLWKCDETFKIDEINVYIKKIQCVQSILNESQKDIILAALVSIVGAILYYMFSFISIGTWNGWTSIFFGDEPKKQLMNVIG